MQINNSWNESIGLITWRRLLSRSCQISY